MKTYGYFMEKGIPGEAGVGEKEYGLEGGRANTGYAFLRGLSSVCPVLSVARPHKLLQRGERGEFHPSVPMGVTSPYFCVAHVWVSYLSGNREAPGQEESS